MKIVFLPSAQRDLEWFRHYYEEVFPEGARRAREQYMQAMATLRTNPEIGPPAQIENHRALPVLRTPFSFVYRIANGRIEIMRVRDGRADK